VTQLIQKSQSRFQKYIGREALELHTAVRKMYFEIDGFKKVVVMGLKLLSLQCHIYAAQKISYVFPIGYT